MYIKPTKISYFVVVIFFVIITTGISSADKVNKDLIAQLGEFFSDTTVVGNYAYVGEGQTLVVLDVTDFSDFFRMSGG